MSILSRKYAMRFPVLMIVDIHVEQTRDTEKSRGFSSFNIPLTF